jgi:RNA polymerase sigma factor (sigma-70 family)
MMSDSETPLTQAACLDLVSRYLAGQGWELVGARDLTAEIWHNLGGAATESAVHTEILRRYAARLHDCCLQAETADYDRAWHELKVWLERRVGRLESHPGIRQETVQEALIALQLSLAQSSLQKPQAFLTFAFQTLRSRHIDLNRQQTAEKRDWRKTIPLEELGAGHIKDKDGRDWEEYLSASSRNWRTIERTVSDQEVRRQLLQFAQEHLPTDLQQMVFEAHFLDGLKPAEIGQLLGKQPHEIRLVKARIVKKIKNLPQLVVEQLLTILGGLESDV